MEAGVNNIRREVHKLGKKKRKREREESKGGRDEAKIR